MKYAHVYRRFHQAQDKAGITNKIRFHDLRHSFASNYMMNGENVFDLQSIILHLDKLAEPNLRRAFFKVL